jgi:glyoxylase I family protein
MFKRIDHVEITTAKIGETIKFYTEVLGFKIKERNKMSRPPLQEISFLTLGDTMLELLGVSEAEAASQAMWQTGYRMMALEVDDMDKTVAELKAKGVEPSRPPMTMGTTKRGEIKDPNGLSIELRQW